MLFDKKEKFFFIGIGGVGMFPLAKLLLHNGYTVLGSDIRKSSSTDELTKLGAQVFYEHSSENIKEATLVIYSSAITSTNPELSFSQKQGITTLHRADLLKEFVNQKTSITVSGTHGKTTSTALIGHVLSQQEKPSRSITLLGGKGLGNDTNLDLETCDYIVAEADESDGSFLKYTPDIAVLTNIESDHLDYYGSFENIIQHFEKHIKSLKGLKTLIYNFDDPVCQRLASNFTGNKISFGFSEKADVSASQLAHKGKNTCFILRTPSQKLTLSLPLIGEHNVLNALSAAAVLEALEKNSFFAFKNLETFNGVKKRLELIYSADQFFFYDDYAHNPGKIKATVSALKKHFPDHQLIALFEPHRYSRISALYKKFCEAFQEADFVLVFPTFCAGEELSLKDYTEEGLAQSISQHCHKPAEAVYNVKRAHELLLEQVTEKTIITSLGAGNISTIAYQIREKILCENSLSTGAS